MQQLQGMTAAGFIRLVGDQYQSAVRFENGKLSVNGQDIPLPSATAASPGEDASTLDIPLEPDGEAPAPAAPAQQ
ncbi:MAG: YdgA family protein [Synechococcaceae cyanobacterium SM1_2_3]|nr:YdgA family protein [Synechococcaceae cyanobacterium SM1_2_3]